MQGFRNYLLGVFGSYRWTDSSMIMAERYVKKESRAFKSMFLIGWVTASIKQVYTSEQLRRIFDLANEA